MFIWELFEAFDPSINRFGYNIRPKDITGARTKPFDVTISKGKEGYDMTVTPNEWFNLRSASRTEEDFNSIFNKVKEKYLANMERTKQLAKSAEEDKFHNDVMRDAERSAEDARSRSQVRGNISKPGHGFRDPNKSFHDRLKDFSG